jgi:hypothetical protein
MMKNILTIYLNGSKLLWLKDSVDPGYAVAIGTAKYDREA